MTALASADLIARIQAQPAASDEEEPDPELELEGEPFTVEHFRSWASHLELDSGEDWLVEDFQEAFLEDVFSGSPECWLIVPEGNGKTTLIAGLALYVCEFSPRPAEVPVAASSREQAGILYAQAEGFVLRSPILHARVESPLQVVRGKRKRLVPRFQPLSGYRRIDFYRGGRIQVFAADDRTGDGVLFKLAILDELHRHRDLDLYRTWVGKRQKRGGQIVAISTAGEPGSEFEDTREKIRQQTPIVERTETFVHARSATIVLHEWAVPEDGDVEDLELVARANPFSAITPEVLAQKLDSPTMTIPHWRRFTCNLATRGSSAAITEAEWAAAKTDEKIPAGEPIWLGLDVAWKLDTTAMVPLWMHDDQRLLGPAVVLIPPRDGNSLRSALVETAILDIHKRNPIHTVVMDPTRAEQLAEWIRTTLGATVVERGQTNPHAAMDYERFMEGLRDGKLHHSGDDGLTRHALNAIALPLPGDKYKFERPHPSRRSAREQERRVIDALVAAAMVHTTAIAVEPPAVEPWVAFG